MEFLGVLATLLFLLQAVCSKSLEDKSTAEPQGSHQCEYHGEKFSEGEDLPTHRMCLSCKCTKEFVEPNDRHCDVIECPQTNHLQLGCVPSYNDTECCPASWDCESSKALIAKCDKKYFKHYEVKGCTPVYENDSECPARFKCPSADEIQDDNTVCKFHGRTYQKGEDIDTGNPCQICSCQRSWKPSEGVHMSCISRECPSIFQPSLNDSCYEFYEKDSCCSVRTECSTDDVKPKSEKVCEYGDRTYHLGQRIYPEEDSCLICTCTEDWTGIHGNSCRVHDCSLERKLSQMREGCIPIYHEATCCPIEFSCGSEEEGFKNTTVPKGKPEDIASGNTCVFKGAHYAVGQLLDINHPTHCVTCTCNTPPDITCVHKSCPRPPNNDYKNCLSTYKQGECCPTYECKQVEPRAPAVFCSPVHCPEGCSEVTVHNSCPFCKCQERLCSPPKCGPGCQVQNEVAEGECPACNCPDPLSILVKPSCSPVKCPSHCYEVTNPSGCPMCICGPLCSPPKCEPGCELQRDVKEGECPGCVCQDDLQSLGSLQCSPVQCPPTCSQDVGASGCPSCICKPLCSPPQCDPGCHVSTARAGFCPECVCGDQELAALQCGRVKCGPLCHEAFDGSGCPSCICDATCSPPKCEEGCHLEHDPSAGPCPECVCRYPEDLSMISGVQCSPPVCEPGCTINYDSDPCPSCSCAGSPTKSDCPKISCGALCQSRIGSDGCPTCLCDPLCSPPKCEEGCHLEFDREAGPCPYCVCLEEIPSVMCSPPKCEDGCHVDYSTKPCPSCACSGVPEVNIMCSPPKCDEGCHVDYNARPCPSCSCGGHSEVPDIMCSPPKCDSGCRVDYTSKPCPSCSCDGDRSGLSMRSGVQCSPPVCDPGCTINYDSDPCPSCSCGTSPKIPDILCSPPKCDPGCQVDYTARPCPSCSCDGVRSGIPDILCSPPKCDAGCRVDFSTKPCPSCKCDAFTGEIPDIMCSPPKCETGCRLDYTTKPCPSCKCDSNFMGLPSLQCSPPKCEPGCHIDYEAKPCPGCKCTGGPDLQCSPPKCETGCRLDYSTKPCPSCKCPASDLPILQCSPPKCDDPGCSIDYSGLPCPFCRCDDVSDLAAIQCSPVQCDPSCREVKGSNGCPSCECGRPQCSIPRCDAGCRIDPFAEPCPACVCDRFLRRSAQLFLPNMFRDPFCATMTCAPGCEMSPSAPSANQRCPMCSCPGRPGERLMCPPMRCQLPCIFERFSEHGCPSCLCHPIPCPPIDCDSGFEPKKQYGQRCPKCVPTTTIIT